MNALLIAAIAFYGVSFDPLTTNAPSASRIVPVNFMRYKMVQPDGAVRYLHRDVERPGVIVGEYPWLGTIEKNVISVWADPAATEGKRRTAFTFVNGQLRNLFLDGVDYKFPFGTPKIEGSLESLWPPKKPRTFEKGSSADIWRNDTRLRLWFANPNSAGLMCVQVALVGLWLLLAGRWYRRLAGLALFAVAFYGVAQSGSRGALLGMIIGAGLMAAFALRKKLNAKTMAAAIAVLGIGVALFASSGLVKRFTGTIGHIDPGNQRRITIGRAAIRMFADAPLGWHCGEVPGRNVALNWYVFDDNHVIRTHLLTMAELGWLSGFGYAFFWMLMLTSGVASARRGKPLALGEWSAFATAGMFNPVYTEASLWILPSAVVVWRMWQVRKYADAKTAVAHGTVAAIGALAIVVALVAVGRMLNAGRKTDIRAAGNGVVVNGETPAVWIVEDKPTLGGWGFPGREALAYYARHPEAPPMGYAYGIDDLPHAVEKLVLPGRAAAEYLEAYHANPGGVCQAKKVVFLSPAVGLDKMDERLLKASKVLWLAGSFIVPLDGGYQRSVGWVRILPGIEQYVPNWMSLTSAQPAPARD